MTNVSNTPDAERQSGATTTAARTAHTDRTTQNSMLGTEHSRSTSNVSWGAIFAGVVTFLALTILLSMVSAAMGLDGASGLATGIWSVVALAIALAVAGYVAGALATRSGLLHGFVTWAASLLAIVALTGLLGSSLLGAVGSVANQANVTAQQAQDLAQQTQREVSEQEIQAAQQQAQQAAEQAATGLWWTFAGTLIGAVIATATGAAGARSVARKETEVSRSA